MLRHCPDAYLLNYSNPMAMLPWAVYAGTGFSNVYGLCHSVRDTHAFLAGLVGADPASVDFVTAGFNHQAFVLRFEQDGESLYPRLAEVIDASPELQRRVRVRAIPAVRLLPDRVQRALGRVRAVVHAARRPGASSTGSSSVTTWPGRRRTWPSSTRFRTS